MGISLFIFRFYSQGSQVKLCCNGSNLLVEYEDLVDEQNIYIEKNE